MLTLPAYLLPFALAALVLGVTALLALLASLLTGRLLRRSNPQVALGARRFAAVLVWIAGGIAAAEEVGVSPVVALVFVALFGIAAILGLRPVLENFSARFFADVYCPFKVGDTIRVGVETGRVIEINAMATILLREDETVVSLPNALFMREVMTNLSPQAGKELTIPLSVPSTVDLAAFDSDLRKSLAKLRLRLDRRFPPVLATRSHGPQSTDLTLTVTLQRPEERDALLADIHGRIADLLGRRPPRSG